MYNSTSIWSEIKNEFKGGNVLSQLILINIGVYLLVLIVKTVFNFSTLNSIDSNQNFETFISWLAAPSDLMSLITKPWTLITYMFLHESFFHILFNMLWLFWMGKILREFLGNKVLLPLYLIGGLFGVGFYILSYNILPRLTIYADSSIILGASAGVTAVVFATAARLPNHAIYLLFLGAVRLKYIALAFLILDLISIANLSNTGGHIAHIGGAVYGVLFVNQLKKGNDWSAGFYKLLSRIIDIFKTDPNLRKRSGRVKSTGGRAKGRSPDAGYQKKIDAILDKISQSGYDSLTKEEKEFLFKASKKE